MATRRRMKVCSHRKTWPIPPTPMRSRSLNLPSVKPFHLPSRNCSPWKKVISPSRTIAATGIFGRNEPVQPGRNRLRFSASKGAKPQAIGSGLFHHEEVARAAGEGLLREDQSAGLRVRTAALLLAAAVAGGDGLDRR